MSCRMRLAVWCRSDAACDMACCSTDAMCWYGRIRTSWRRQLAAKTSSRSRANAEESSLTSLQLKRLRSGPSHTRSTRSYAATHLRRVLILACARTIFARFPAAIRGLAWIVDGTAFVWCFSTPRTSTVALSPTLPRSNRHGCPSSARWT